METLIRRCIMQRLIWDCTVCSPFRVSRQQWVSGFIQSQCSNSVTYRILFTAVKQLKTLLFFFSYIIVTVVHTYIIHRHVDKQKISTKLNINVSIKLEVKQKQTNALHKVVVVLLLNVHGQQLRSYWDGQLTQSHFSWAGL